MLIQDDLAEAPAVQREQPPQRKELYRVVAHGQFGTVDSTSKTVQATLQGVVPEFWLLRLIHTSATGFAFSYSQQGSEVIQCFAPPNTRDPVIIPGNSPVLSVVFGVDPTAIPGAYQVIALSGRDPRAY